MHFTLNDIETNVSANVKTHANADFMNCSATNMKYKCVASNFK